MPAINTKKLSTTLALVTVAVVGLLSYLFGADLWETGLIRKQSPKQLNLAYVNTQLTRATIERISDGDSFSVKGRDGEIYRIRLQAMDAPEGRQAYGNVCHQNLIKMIGNQRLRVEVIDIDRYQRLVAKAYVGSRDLGLEQIRQGCAWHYVAYARQQSPANREAYAAAEQEARRKKVGLWRDSNPIAPWDYRRR